jgi:hypothetical protein
MIEIGVVNEPSAGFTAPNAKRLEDMGFDYLLTPDTQNLSADPYGQLSLAAAATKTIKLGTGVTNPITRDVAVTASALATLQIESNGRAICGMGRGDSSAAHIGKKQATGEQLAFYANSIRTYIAGGTVDRDGTQSAMRWIKPVMCHQCQSILRALDQRLLSLPPMSQIGFPSLSAAHRNVCNGPWIFSMRAWQLMVAIAAQ